MGTNYYATFEPPCPYYGRGGEELHIGKSSGGWCFSVHVELNNPTYPHSWEDWLTWLKDSEMAIRDEYGTAVTLGELERIVTDRKSYAPTKPFVADGRYHDEDEWMLKNHATPGPFGLARHAIGDGLCVAHGAGTWDCLEGEFS